jgi:hypothetical protein
MIVDRRRLVNATRKTVSVRTRLYTGIGPGASPASLAGACQGDAMQRCQHGAVGARYETRDGAVMRAGRNAMPEGSHSESRGKADTRSMAESSESH